MARIAVAGFHHETNCFVDSSTDFSYFASHRDRPPLVIGQQVIEWLQDNSFAMGGYIRDMRARHELVPLLWTSGGAGGMVTREAFERIACSIVGLLSQQMPVDAVYLDLHGAMVTEDFEDAEGELLRRVRAAVGDAVPIVVSLDYHANVTPQMVMLSDSMVGYRTYPHVDRVETGQYAAVATEALLKRGRPAGRALRKTPFLIPLNGQCTLVDPSRMVVGLSRVCEGELINLSYLAGFPPSDLHWCGPSVVAHAWTQQAADRAADEMLAAIVDREGEFAEEMVSPEAGVARALALSAVSPRTVVIADTQDNPGCGGSADSTGLLKALIAADARDAVLGHVCDPQAALAAHRAGLGATVELELGGHSGPAGVSPVRAAFVVEALGDGRFVTDGSVAGGRKVDMGPMALLRVGGVSVTVTSKRLQAYDKAPFRHLGIEPGEQRILALKSTCHYRAEFEPLAQQIIVVLAPGYYVADPTHYPFRRLRDGVRLKPLGNAFHQPASRTAAA